MTDMGLFHCLVPAQLDLTIEDIEWIISLICI